MTTPLVSVGADPGPRWTGLAARRGDDYLAHELLRRCSAPRIPELAYRVFVIERIEALLAAVRRATGEEPQLAVEAANGPTGFKDGGRAALNPVDVFALGLVIGAVTAHFPDAQVIPPDNYGRGLLACYPTQLRGARERGPVGTGVLRHCRSAWDVAGHVQLPRRLAVLAITRTAEPPDTTTSEPAHVVSQGGLAVATTSLPPIRPARRQRHDWTQPEGDDAA